MMTIFDGKNPRFFLSVPTEDGRWMVAHAVDGKLTILPTFLGSEDDAQAICRVYDAREMDGYRSESEQQFIDSIRAEDLTLEEIAKKLGIKL
jgi:hypothetical protein